MQGILKPEIRKLTEDDVTEFWQLRLQALKNDPESFGADYKESKYTPLEETARRIKPSENSFVLGAFAPKLIGMLGFYRREGLKQKHKGNIWGMYVTPHIRGQGVGRLLLDEILRILRPMEDLEEVTLSVAVKNTTARSLYLSAGFAIYGLELNARKVDGRYVDEEFMGCRLK